MKLLEIIEKVRIKDIELLEMICDALEYRIEDIECMEPNSDYDFFHDKWEEKHSGACEIYDEFKEIFEEVEEFNECDENKECIDKLEKQLNELKDKVVDYQYEFGGLKKINV